MARVAVLGDELLLGTCTRAVLRDGCPAAVVDGVCPVNRDVGPGGASVVGVLEAADLEVLEATVVGALEATPSAAPPEVTRSPAPVLLVSSGVASVELRWAAEVPLVNVTGEGAAMVISTDVSLSRVFTDAFLFTNPCHVLLGTKLRGLLDAAWLSDKDKEKIQMSTRAVHILQMSWKQGWAVPEAPSQPAPQAANGSLLLGQGIRGCC